MSDLNKTRCVQQELLPNIRAAYWAFDEGTGNTIIDYNRKYIAYPATLFGGPNWTSLVPDLAYGKAGWGYR